MKALRLNRKLVLERRRSVADGAGGFSKQWVETGVIWSQVTPRTGRLGGSGAAALSRMAFKIVLRATPLGAPSRPRPNQRLREGDRAYRIEAVAEYDPEGRYLVCYAKEETAV